MFHLVMCPGPSSTTAPVIRETIIPPLATCAFADNDLSARARLGSQLWSGLAPVTELHLLVQPPRRSAISILLVFHDQLRDLAHCNRLPLVSQRKSSQLGIILEPLDANLASATGNL